VNEVRVRVAEAAVAQGDSLLATVGLGSCVAIVLHDAAAQVGGLAHVLLPSDSMSRDRANRAKFPASAVPLLVEQMRALGAQERRITARLVGGASMFTNLLPAGGLQIGERNILASRVALAHARIPVIGEDTGGGHGRSVYFRIADGSVEVRSMAKGHVAL
jgi:chemotaxis protein CheD